MTPYHERLKANYYQDKNIVWGEKEATQTTEAEAYTCDECGKEFTTQHGLTVHQGKAHT